MKWVWSKFIYHVFEYLNPQILGSNDKIHTCACVSDDGLSDFVLQTSGVSGAGHFPGS